MMATGCTNPPAVTEAIPPIPDSTSSAATPTLSAAVTPSPTGASSRVVPTSDSDRESLYGWNLIGVASEHDVPLGDASEAELLRAGRAACSTFDMGADLRLAAAALALEDYLPHDLMKVDSYTLIAMAAASALCQEHMAAAGFE